MKQNTAGSVWLKLRLLIKDGPVDLVLLGSYFVVSALILVSEIGPLPLRALLGFPLLLFVPGYAVLSALFPHDARDERQEFSLNAAADRKWGIDLPERLALSFGLSIALLPLVSFGLVEWGVGLRLEPLLAALATISGVGFVLGALGRYRLPSDERFQLPIDQWSKRLYAYGGMPAHTKALWAVLVLAAVFAVASLGSGLLVADADASYTSMALLTKNDSGSYVAGGYTPPEEGSTPLFIAVNNHEGSSTDYTVVVQAQETDSADESRRVVAVRELTRLRATVSANETWYGRHAVDPDRFDADTRIAYLLYKGSPPPEPSVDSAYRHTYIWPDGSPNRTSPTV